MKDILFLDIETAANYSSYSAMPDNWKELWFKKSKPLIKESFDTPENVYTRAAIYPEFSRIVCISIGYIHEGAIRTTSFTGVSEKSLLEEFAALINKQEKRFKKLCAHNGKAFDYPFICKRMILHKVKIPAVLNQEGKKPWEILNIDTMEQWSFGVFGAKTSLDLLCAFFDIPSPKGEMDGSQVHYAYHVEQDDKKIYEYCEKDVRVLALVYARINNFEI